MNNRPQLSPSRQLCQFCLSPWPGTHFGDCPVVDKSPIDQLIPARYSPDEFNKLVSLDSRLPALIDHIDALSVPQREPAYSQAWRQIERKLARVIRHPQNPMIRTRYGLEVLHDGLRRHFWYRAEACSR